MIKPLFDTKTLNLSELLSNSKIYKVPRFQRSYSWTEDNWEDLWQDIFGLKNNEESVHYLGTIVLQTQDNKTFTIIDGQQRIVTLSILILTCVKLLQDFVLQKIDEEKNRERKEIFMNKYIGFKDPKALTYQSKLTLNDTDKGIYNSYLIQFPRPLNLSNLPESNRLLLKAYDFFYENLKKENFKSGEEIVDFIESIISNRLFFIQIVVDDTLSAYTVFETLNARGVKLTTTDLLKNYLFSLLDNNIDIDNIQPRWDKVVNLIGYRKFPRFLRYYLNSQKELIREEKLFREIKKNTNKQEDVIKLIEDLDRYSDVYVALDDYESELWQGKEEIKNLLREIKLFDVEQYKPLLLSVYFKMNDHLESVLKIIRAITFRYTIIGNYNPNQLEKTYNKASIKITKGEIIDPKDLHKELSQVYIDDEVFRNNFSIISFDTRKTKMKKIVRYILLTIENQNYNKNYSILDTNPSIEHIYPENYTGEKILNPNLIYRLGNLTILETNLNKQCNNKKFDVKKSIYQKSQYEITKELVNNEEWTENNIKNRQQQFAKIATSIWRSPYV
ncbi:MAG: DUF262 domain-containing protein [Leptonema sp. (in: bacteria)]